MDSLKKLETFLEENKHEISCLQLKLEERSFPFIPKEIRRSVKQIQRLKDPAQAREVAQELLTDVKNRIATEDREKTSSDLRARLKHFIGVQGRSLGSNPFNRGVHVQYLTNAPSPE